MSTTLLKPPVHNWACPSCGGTDRTQRAEPHTQMHECKALRGLTVPYVEVYKLDDKPDGQHRVLMREDYVGDSGMPATMAVQTDHGDGSNDRTVFAPTASTGLNVLGTHGAVATRPNTASLEAQVRMHHNFRDPRIAKMARAAHGTGAMMAWSASAVFAYAVLQLTSNSIKPSTDSYKVALYGNSGTPDRTVTTAALTEYNGTSSQWVTANEASGTGYTAGGVAVTPISITQSTNVVTFTSSGTPQWTTATITAYGCLVYDTTVSNEGFCYNYFGGVQSVTAGTFTIVWNASGIATFTC